MGVERSSDSPRSSVSDRVDPLLLLFRAHPAAQAIEAQTDVVQDRACLGDEHFLEHGRDSVLLSDPRRARMRDLAAADLDRAGVGCVNAAEDLHQRALPRAVLADDRVHLAGEHLERGIPERLGGSERLCHSRHADEGRALRRAVAGWNSTLFCRCGREPRVVGHIQLLRVVCLSSIRTPVRLSNRSSITFAASRQPPTSPDQRPETTEAHLATTSNGSGRSRP